MSEGRQISIPSAAYMHTCLEGYDIFRFDKNILLAAYDRCSEVRKVEG